MFNCCEQLGRTRFTVIPGTLACLLLLQACGGAAPAASPSAAEPASPPPAVASVEAPPPAKPEPTATLVPQLPPHGNSTFHMVFGANPSKITPTFANSTLDKVQVLDDSMEFSASPKGNAGMNLPDVKADNFVLSMKLRSVAGAGTHVLAFRRTSGDYPSVNFNTNTGTVGLSLQTNGKFNKWIVNPVLKWPRDATGDVSVAISALGAETVVCVNGAEALRSKDTPVTRGSGLGFYVNGPQEGDTPFVARLTDLQLFDPEASAMASLQAVAAAALPPHGDLVYELKPTPPSANVKTTLIKPADKVQVLTNGLGLAASPGGSVSVAVPDLMVDDFVAEVEVFPVSGAGSYAFVFHGGGGAYHQVFVSQSAGTLEIDRMVVGQTAGSKKLFGSEPRFAPGSKNATSFVVVSHGQDFTVYIDGKEAGKASDVTGKGALGFALANVADAKEPFVAELRTLRIYAPAPNQPAASQPPPK